MKKTVHPAASLQGTITLPPDKSISHRAAMFAALSEEESVIDNYSEAADPQSTLSCLEQLGVEVKREENRVNIQGAGRDGFRNPEEPLDCGNSGTTMRLMSGILAGAGVTCTLTGDDSLSSRTMKRVINPLRQMGCTISGRDDQFAPLSIGEHNGVQAIRFPLPIASAQLKSCVLLAGLFGEKPTEVIETVLSRDHTERLLGLKSEPYGTGKIIRSSRSDKLPPQSYRVPGDFSGAAFWLVGGLLSKDSEIKLPSVGTNPSRTALLAILEEMGASITVENPGMEGDEPVADFTVSGSKLKPVNPDPALIPNCIDELPILMVAMCFADGVSTITGAEELRHKETDRLEAMHEILTAAGAKTELHQDGITIYGDPGFVPKPAVYNPYHDHRMAMAAAILAGKSDGESEVLGADCTAISYPSFWEDLERVRK